MRSGVKYTLEYPSTFLRFFDESRMRLLLSILDTVNRIGLDFSLSLGAAPKQNTFSISTSMFNASVNSDETVSESSLFRSSYVPWLLSGSLCKTIFSRLRSISVSSSFSSRITSRINSFSTFARTGPFSFSSIWPTFASNLVI